MSEQQQDRTMRLLRERAELRSEVLRHDCSYGEASADDIHCPPEKPCTLHQLERLEREARTMGLVFWALAVAAGDGAEAIFSDLNQRNTNLPQWLSDAQRELAEVRTTQTEGEKALWVAVREARADGLSIKTIARVLAERGFRVPQQGGTP